MKTTQGFRLEADPAEVEKYVARIRQAEQDDEGYSGACRYALGTILGLVEVARFHGGDVAGSWHRILAIAEALDATRDEKASMRGSAKPE